MRVEREIIKKLNVWRDKTERKPLLLNGARQTGKTWVMKHFGEQCFDNVAMFDFDTMPELSQVFKRTKDPQRLVKELSLYVENPIEPGGTLIIFDEVQQCGEALNSLKYFCEEAPQYHIIAAGSLLGLTVKRKQMSVPVGKVQIEEMHPVSFSEFLQTSDHRTWEYVNDIETIEPLPEIIMSRLADEYRRYMVSGGMPEAVVAMLEGNGMGEVDSRIDWILNMYLLDFSKYAETTMIPRINSLWSSLPSQLAKENRKFLYSVVKPGARAREYEDGLLWLEEAGMIHKIFCVSKPAFPVSAYRELSAFKVYACDCGILRRLAKLSPDIVLNSNAAFTEFRGSLTENMVLQSLVQQTDDGPYYWTSGNQAEVDFLLPMAEQIVPIEVKSNQTVHSRSLSVYNEKYKPAVRVRLSANNLQYRDGLLNCPLYLTDWLTRITAMIKD